MKYLFRPRYIRSIKKLDKSRAANVQKTFESLVRFFQTGEKPFGLGLKQLRRDIWEVRAGLLDRIIFRRTKNTVEFIIAGTHNEIKRYLNSL
ncbi:MAG: hypothetical protein V1833_04850 [Elusimicrobiota bacterium]